MQRRGGFAGHDLESLPALEQIKLEAAAYGLSDGEVAMIWRAGMAAFLQVVEYFRKGVPSDL